MGRACRCSSGKRKCPTRNRFAPAIFPTIRVAEGYDYIEQNGGDPAESGIAGASSFEYSEPYDTFSIITEVAYFDDPRVNDQTPTGVQRREAILQGLDLGDEGGNTMRAHFDAVAKELKGDSPFQNSVEWWAGFGKRREVERNWAQTNPETERPATVAEHFSSIEQTQFYRLLGMGMLLRMLEGEIAIGNGTPAIRRQLIESTKVFEEWADRLEARWTCGSCRSASLSPFSSARCWPLPTTWPGSVTPRRRMPRFKPRRIWCTAADSRRGDPDDRE